MKYKTIRFYHKQPSLKVVVLTGLTLEQAKKRCSDPETSSATATSEWAQQHTQVFGAWFEGFTEEYDCDRSWQDSPCEGELIERSSAGGFITATCEKHLYELEEVLAGIADRYPEVNHPEYCTCAGCEGAW